LLPLNNRETSSRIEYFNGFENSPAEHYLKYKYGAIHRFVASRTGQSPEAVADGGFFRMR
jgi:hypothetical protein